MYDHIVGEVVEAQPARAVLRAHGVGYELKVPVRAARELRVGSEATLFTILHVVDGMPTLLGFATRAERDLARRLMTVSGVGPSVCLAVLSTYSAEDVVGAILAGDAHSLRRVRGVGSKLAERLCLELRDAMARFELRPSAEPRVVPLPRATEDAIAGLVVLGYGEKEARAKVAKVIADRGREQTTEEKIGRA